MGQLIRQRLSEDGVGKIAVGTGLSNGSTLLDGIPLSGSDGIRQASKLDRFQWQVQGDQLRLALVLPTLAGRSERAIARRVAEAKRHESWFDFGPARDVLGSRCGPETGKWLRFNPDFVYRNVKLDSATVQDAVELSVRYSRRLAEWATPTV